MIEMDYIVDGLDELISDESALIEDTTDAVNGSRLILWETIVERVINSVMTNIGEFNDQSKHNIFKAIAERLSRTQFCSMLVYSRYRDIPYLDGIFVNVSGKLASMSRSRALNAFYNAFYDKKIDNTVLSCEKRIMEYAKFFLNIRVSMVVNLLSDENMYRSMYNISRIFASDFRQTIAEIKDSIECDVMEYGDIGDVINQHDEDPNIYTLLLAKTDEVCVNSVNELIFDTVINNILNYDNIRSKSTVFKREVNPVAMTELTMYVNDVNKIANKIIFEDADKFAYEYELQITDIIIRSLVEHFTDYKMKQLTNMFIDDENHIEYNVEIVTKLIDMLLVI